MADEISEYYDKSIQYIVETSIKKKSGVELDTTECNKLYDLKIPTSNPNFINNVITKLLPDDYVPPNSDKSGAETPPGGGSRRRRKNRRNSKRKRK